MPVFLTSSKSSAECSLLGFKANEEIGTNGNHGSAFDFQLPMSHWTLSCITLHWNFCDTVTVAIFWYPWEFMLFLNQPGSSSMGALQWWWNDFKSVFFGAFWDPSTVSMLKFSAVIQLFPFPRFEVWCSRRTGQCGHAAFGKIEKGRSDCKVHRARTLKNLTVLKVLEQQLLHYNCIRGATTHFLVSLKILPGQLLSLNPTLSQKSWPGCYFGRFYRWKRWIDDSTVYSSPANIALILWYSGLV